MKRLTSPWMFAALSLIPALARAQEHSPADMTMAIAGMISGIVFVLGVVGIALYAAAKRTRHRLELVARLIEQGQRVPRELLFENPMPNVAEQRHRDLRRGIWMLCWAAGVALAFYFLSGQIRATAWSLIFLFLAAGSFINLYLSRRVEGTGKDDLPREQ